MSTPEVSLTESALARIEELTPVKIFTEPGSIDPLLDAVEAKAREEAAKLDISTEANRKRLASLAYSVGKGKNRLDKLRISLVSEQKAQLKKIDTEGKRIWDRLEFLQDEVRKPLTEWENADKERIAALEANIAEIEGGGRWSAEQWQTLSVEAMQDRLAEILKEGERDWQEFKHRAAQAIATATAQIRDAIAKREKYDSEQAELASLRAEQASREQKEREEAIARKAKEEAEAKAKAESERAAKEAAEAIERVAREKLEAEDRAAKAEADAKAAAEKAESDRIAAEKKAQAEKDAAIQQERRRIAEEQEAKRKAQEKRESNKRHVAKIHGEIVSSLEAAGIGHDDAVKVVELIANGKIPHTSIQY